MLGRSIGRPGLFRSRTWSSAVRLRKTSRVIRVNSSGSACRVRSVYETSRGVLPQPASKTSASALVHVNSFAVRNRLVEERRDPHRDPHAAVAGGVRRDGRVAVDGIATCEVQRVVEGPEWTG